MSKELYISLITKNLSQELSAAEISDLNDWVSGSKANKEILTDYVETGTSYQGELPLVGYGREICYYLSNNKNKSVDVMLRANNALK